MEEDDLNDTSFFNAINDMSFLKGGINVSNAELLGQNLKVKGETTSLDSDFAGDRRRSDGYELGLRGRNRRGSDSVSRRLLHYRGLLKIMEEEFSGPPFTVVGELLIGLVLCLWAGLIVPGTFLSIHPYSEENRIVSLPANLDFMVFNHRGDEFEAEALRSSIYSSRTLFNFDFFYSLRRMTACGTLVHFESIWKT